MAAVGLDPCLRSHRVLAQGSAACLGPPATSLFDKSAWGRVHALQPGNQDRLPLISQELWHCRFSCLRRSLRLWGENKE